VAIRAGRRDGDAITKEQAMTGIPDINQTWPDAIVDIGPIELIDHYWVIVGSIPYDGHVVLAVIGSPPSEGHSTHDHVPAPPGPPGHRVRAGRVHPCFHYGPRGH
jgi:hypothetical protein